MSIISSRSLVEENVKIEFHPLSFFLLHTTLICVHINDMPGYRMRSIMLWNNLKSLGRKAIHAILALPSSGSSSEQAFSSKEYKNLDKRKIKWQYKDGQISSNSSSPFPDAHCQRII